MIVEVGHSGSADTSVLHIPHVGLVVAGDVIYNGAHLYLGARVVVGVLGPWRDAIDKVAALKPRHIVAGHQNKQLDMMPGGRSRETRQYLDDADEFLRTENTVVGFFNAKIERYPNHRGRTVLWTSASALYGVREHPGEDVGQIVGAGWHPWPDMPILQPQSGAFTRRPIPSARQRSVSVGAKGGIVTKKRLRRLPRQPPYLVMISES